MQPDDIGSHMNVARTNTRLKRFEEAEEVYVYTKKLLHQVELFPIYSYSYYT